MKVTYNEQEEAIEIQDNTKMHFWGLKILMLVNFMNASLHFYLLKGEALTKLSYIWICISVVSLAFLLYLIIKKTSLEKIPLDKIRGLQKENFFGRRNLRLVLKNGKSRDVIFLQTQSEIEDLNKTFSEARITTIVA